MRRFAFLLLPVLACSARQDDAREPFATSARSAGVPRDLLVAIAAVEGGLDMPARREVDPDAELPAAGPLMLRHGKRDTLARGAELMGTSELALRRDTDLALEAGARVLAELGAETGATSELSTWEPALEEMSGYADAAHRRDYARRVLRTLAAGGDFEGRDGQRVVLPPHEIPPSLLLEDDEGIRLQAPTSEFPGAEWIPTSCVNKCNTSRSGASITMLAIHDTEGGWDASVATLQNDPGKSAHYIVGTDGRVAQFIPESYTGWHVGNAHYNQRMVGIEHVGYSTKPFPEAEYAASAKLIEYLAAKYKIQRDRAHIIGHDQVPNPNVIASSSAPCSDSPKACAASSKWGGASKHTDPGVWEWATYMPRVGASAKCNDVTSLFNCSSDLSRAFRCSAGQVEVLTCDGPKRCTVRPNGEDDLCDRAAKTNPSGSFPAPAPTAPRERAETQERETGEEEEAGGGCAIARETRGADQGSALLSLLALAAFARRRRKRAVVA